MAEGGDSGREKDRAAVSESKRGALDSKVAGISCGSPHRYRPPLATALSGWGRGSKAGDDHSCEPIGGACIPGTLHARAGQGGAACTGVCMHARAGQTRQSAGPTRAHVARAALVRKGRKAGAAPYKRGEV